MAVSRSSYFARIFLVLLITWQTIEAAADYSQYVNPFLGGAGPYPDLACKLFFTPAFESGARESGPASGRRICDTCFCTSKRFPGGSRQVLHMPFEYILEATALLT